MNNGDCNNRLAAVAQSVERRIGSAEVTGPIPVSSFHARLKPCKTREKDRHQARLNACPFLLFYRAQPVTELKRTRK